MIIGGLQKFSLLDFPGHVSAIVFTQGCNFRCSFCYNPMLVWPVMGEGKLAYDRHIGGQKQKNHPFIPEDDFLSFLRNRKGKLDGVVVSGGEPTIQPDLPDFLAKIKTLGFAVKLDSNGSNPQMLADIIEKKLVDYIAMDLKSSEEKYRKIGYFTYGL